MAKFFFFVDQLRRNVRAATAIEYGLLLALLALAMLAILNSLGFTLAGVFDTASNAMRG